MAGRGRPTRGEVFVENGRYCIRFQVGGERVYEVTECETRASAMELVQQRIVEVRIALGLPRDGRTNAVLGVAALMKAWKDDVERRESDYERIRPFARFVGPEKNPALIDESMVTDWAQHRARTVQDSTRARELSILSAFFRWAVQRRHVSRNPVRGAGRPSKITHRTPDPLTREERATVLAAVAGHPMLEPAFWLGFYAGLRRSEIAGQEWRFIDLKSRRMLVNQGTKTRRSRAWIPILAPLHEWLSGRDNQTGAVVRGRGGAPVQPNALSYALRRWNSVDSNIRLPNWHVCRHTFAALLVAGGQLRIEEVAAILRDSIKMVETTYGHYSALTFEDRYRNLDV